MQYLIKSLFNKLTFGQNVIEFLIEYIILYEYLFEKL